MPNQKAYNPAAFDNIEDPEVQYWAGFMMADGCVTKLSNRQAFIQLALSAPDREHVAKFRAFLKAEHPVRDYGPKPTRWPDGTVGVDKGHARISLHSDRLAAGLARFGVLPRKTMTASSELGSTSSHFWRGVCDGDGHIRVNSLSRQKDVARVQMLGSEALMRQFSTFINERIPGHDIRAFSFKSIWQVRLSCFMAFRAIQLMYGCGGTSLDRKQATADAILSRSDLCPPETFNRRWSEYSNEQLLTIFEECGRNYKTMGERFGVKGSTIHFLLTRTRGITRRWKKHRLPNQKVASPISSDDALHAQ